MRDVPMPDVDRERMREEFENFDDMTVDEFRQAARARLDTLLDTMNVLRWLDS